MAGNESVDRAVRRERAVPKRRRKRRRAPRFETAHVSWLRWLAENYDLSECRHEPVTFDEWLAGRR